MRLGKKFYGRWQATTLLKCTLIARLSSKELPEQKLSGIALVYCSCFDSLWNDTKPFSREFQDSILLKIHSSFRAMPIYFKKGLNQMHFYWLLDETLDMWKHLEWAHMNISLYTRKILFADFSLSLAPEIPAPVIGFYHLDGCRSNYLNLAQSLESQRKTQCFLIGQWWT